jgi:hypothetical protein
MTRYLIKATKTVTTISTTEKVVDLPTDNPLDALAYARVGAAFGDYSDKNPLKYARWEVGPDREEIEFRVLDAPAEEEVEPAPEQPPTPVPAVEETEF